MMKCVWKCLKMLKFDHCYKQMKIEIAPNIVVPDLPASPSNKSRNEGYNMPNKDFNDGYDKMCMRVLDIRCNKYRA